MKKSTAIEMGMTVTKENDQRFDIDHGAAGAAKYLKTLDGVFSKSTVLTDTRKSIPISDKNERLKFDLAAYNGGPGRIAEAQRLTKGAGKDPTKWDEVKEFLKTAGASSDQVKETKEYVRNILQYSKEFTGYTKKNGSDGDCPAGEHWITKDGRHILMKD